MLIGNKEFDTANHCYVMGILNTTPDSFSDGGKYNTDDLALKHVEQMIEEGASIIDVGGESTRPGFEKVSIEEEIDRTAKIIEKIKQNYDIPVSIDSYKYEVAKAALEAGADMVNDIRGFRYNPQIAELTAKHNVACCLMHWREKAEYNDFIKEVLDDLKISIDIAKKGGVPDSKIVLDPGVGFGKTREMNLEITNKVDMLKSLGYPVLLGTSRKSMIGLTLDLPTDERVEGTLATTVIGVMRGCGFVRVHDVKENYRAIKMTEAILARNGEY